MKWSVIWIVVVSVVVITKIACAEPRSNYDQWIHLKGSKSGNEYQVSEVEGGYHPDNQPVQRQDGVSVLHNETLIIINGGCSGSTYIPNDVWQYSIKLNQWRRLKEAPGTGDVSGELFQYNVSNSIGRRRYRGGSTIVDDSNILVFGGENWFSPVEYNSEMWLFSIGKRQWLRMDDFDENYEGNGVDRLGGRRDFGFVRIGNDKAAVISGFGFHLALESQRLDDVWTLDLNSFNFSLIRDSGYSSDPVFGQTGVYNSSNTPGSIFAFSTVATLESNELYIVGGNSISFAASNIVWSMNISSWEWQYVAGTLDDLPVFGTTNEFNENNFPGARWNHGNVLLNGQIILFGGRGYDILLGYGHLNDVFLFDLEEKKWKFRSRDTTKIRDRYPEYGATEGVYRSENTIGGIEGFLMYLMNNDTEILVAMGKGFYMDDDGYLGDVWKLELVPRCFGLLATDEVVCNQNGKCVDYDCQCNDGFYDDDCSISSCFGLLSNVSALEICNGLGLCVDGRCLCYSSSAYTLDDCSIDEVWKKFDETLPVIIIVVSVVLVALVVGVILVVISLVVICCLCKKVKRFDELDDVEMLLQEQRAEKDSSIPKHRINKSLFEVDPKMIKIHGKIGEGGSGAVVYRGEWNNQSIAYKCFHTHEFLEEDRYKAFEKELEILSSISFPYILTFYGATLSESRLGIVMEFCSRGDLGTFLKGRKEPYSFGEKLRLLFEVASAMSFLHSKKIIHRDLKAENVLVTDQERCKVMDFGMSKFNDGKTKTRKVGTSIYMAPEVLSGIYSYSCDVFSFSILSFCVITENWVPYGKINVFGIESRVAEDETLRPSLVGYGVLDELQKLMIRNWSHNANERMNFEDILLVLTKLSKGEGGKEQLGKSSKKKKKRSGAKRIPELEKEIQYLRQLVRDLKGSKRNQKVVIEKHRKLNDKQKKRIVALERLMKSKV